MQVTRFSAGDDGQSRFSTVEITFPHERADAFGHTIRSSDRFASPSVQFAVLPDGLDQDWHPAPRRQLVAILTGAVEVGTPDGATRRFGPGEVFLADDVGTAGHTTKTVGGPAQVMFAPVPDDARVIWA
jgi:hypothetical protein